MHRLQEKYNKEVVTRLKDRLGYKNNMAVPKITKVVINVGAGQALRDPKFLEVAENTLKRITGQKATRRAAKKSISAFKIREGLTVGLSVTLRGKRMLDFVDKLINITMPRVRDFRGIEKKCVDDHGNLNLGFREHMAFPEIKSDEVEKIHGLQVTVVTNAKTQAEGIELFKQLGFPIKD